MSLTVVEKADATSFTVKWELEYPVCSRTKVGNFIESPKFAVYRNSDIEWYLRLYPRGEREEYQDQLSLYLYASAEIRATADLRILNIDGVKVKNYIIAEKVFGKANKTRGTGKMMPFDYTRDPANRVLNAENKLTVECEITYKRKIREVEDLENHGHLPQLQSDLEALFNDPKFSDVTVISEGASLKLHKSILAKRSSVFAGMFDAEMRETLENAVEITDIKYDVLVEMFRFIYAGKVNNIDALAGELAVAADKYALDALKKKCEMTMVKNISVANVVYALQLADKHCLDELKMTAIEFMIANAADVSTRKEFNSLSREIVREVFSYLPKINSNNVRV
ncbi:speckle-type POZ protein B-like [Nasonia vitripennis]|uniref:Roadkill n=1 Tax=Nasonia vitripennis TaxID=7425 RepID=A0A7M7HGU1_NASVI|nr:speckle-type POZ protein B-like [Nasonia vitripennis]XP_008215306.1 speckle-type POZ protein B-like [Nasonia vitripennis]